MNENAESKKFKALAPIQRQTYAMKALIGVFLVLGFCFSELARAGFEVPALTGPVVDDAGLLSRSTRDVVANALRELRARGGSQITVLTIDSLSGISIEEAGIKVVDTWKLGDKKVEDGVLLLIAKAERKIRIEVGRGREGVLTDADSKRIIDQSIKPLFKAGDYDSGVLVGIYQIAHKTDPAVDLEPFLQGGARSQSSTPEEGSPLRIFVIIVIVIIFLMMRGGRRSRFYGGGGGSWGGGGFGGGGSSGGGWSGGGGGFSGGGASGDW